MNVYSGMPAAEGTACALAAVLRESSSQAVERTLDEAIAVCLEEVRQLRDKAAAELGQDSAEIFDAYEMLLLDDYMISPIRELHAQGTALEEAVDQALELQASLFAGAKSEYMQQRAEDIHNIRRMLQRALKGSAGCIALPENGEKFILFAESLSPTDTMRVDQSRLAGLVTRYGGATSHVVILAKNLGIPAITGFEALPEVTPGELVVIDGKRGSVTVSPDAKAVEEAAAAIAAEQEFRTMLASLPKGEVTLGGEEAFHVSVNIGLSSDLDGLDMTSLYGVGLYRTEFLFSERSAAPTVAEQAAEYAAVFDKLAGKDLIVRTLDIGGDKVIPYLDLPREENPFLGCRGIRLCFRQEQLLRDQFTALLTAAAGRPFSVMFPMISGVSEFRRAKALWKETAEMVAAQGCAVSADIRLGVMIETPSAAFCADILAREVDFASIGTNDLTQYVLAADRGNPAVGVKLSYCDPGVLRAIYQIITAFRQAGVKLSVCGEAGSDTAFLPLMAAMGLRYVSVSRSMIDRVRYTVMRMDLKAERERLETVLAMATEEEVSAALRQESGMRKAYGLPEF